MADMSFEVEELREYCNDRQGVTEEFPFNFDTLVFKVKGKMFALCNLKEEVSRVNLKCDPDFALALRQKYDAIIPGYHMNKKHWNTVYMDGRLSDELIKELIDHSYDLVVAKLTKAQRKALGRD